MPQTMDLSDIKISSDFLGTNPNNDKITKAIKYIEKHNRIDKAIVLNNGVLVDNYVRYIAATIKGLQKIPFVELQQMNYIIGKYENNDKEYIWKNDRNINIQIGDKVIVRNRHKKPSVVTISHIFSSDSLYLYNKHLSIVRKIDKC